jgi:outer membrane receptor for ferrienterochelin and colicin
MENQQILDLPLNGRDFLQLTGLQPGVATKSLTGTGYNDFGLSVNGMRSRDNDFRLDGIRVMASYNNNMSTKPPLDAIEEFQMVRNNYSAEYGRAMGGIIEVRTKSGGNAFMAAPTNSTARR